ncbi:hypothetical protein J1N35_039621, partial [Gossypium stocksii]
MRDCQNVSQAESEKGTSLHCYSSALSPKQRSRSKEIDNICEIIVDGFPDYHMETSNPTDTVKSGSGLGLYNHLFDEGSSNDLVVNRSSIISNMILGDQTDYLLKSELAPEKLEK